MDTGLNGKVALVTGGGRDVGAEICRSLAAEGAKVAINYHSSKDEADQLVAEIQAAGGTAKAVQADISPAATTRSCGVRMPVERTTGRIRSLGAGHLRSFYSPETRGYWADGNWPPPPRLMNGLSM